MNFSQYAAKIKAVGRDINPDALTATREIITPLMASDALVGVAITRDLQYGTDERHRLDVFSNESSNDLKPVLLFVHGGGFIGGDKHAEGSPFYSNIGAWAVKNGFAGVNMTYRLAPDNPWPAGIEDIRAAIDFIKTKGADHGLNGNQIFLMGQSAGAAHAAGYIAHPEHYGDAPHGLAGAILLSGIYDYEAMPATAMEQAYLGNDKSCYEERSSAKALLETDVPLLLTMAEYDPPKFQAQTMQLLSNWWHRKEKGAEELPRHLYLLGQNHLSVALYLGLEDDQLAPQLKRFIQEHTQA